MATMIGLFSSIGEHVPIFRKEKLHETDTEGVVNRFVEINNSRHVKGILIVYSALIMDLL